MTGTPEETNKPSKTVTMEDIPLDQVMEDGEGIAPQDKEEQAKGHRHISSRIGSVYRDTGGEIRTVPSAHQVEIASSKYGPAQATHSNHYLSHEAPQIRAESFHLDRFLILLWLFYHGIIPKVQAKPNSSRKYSWPLKSAVD